MIKSESAARQLNEAVNSLINQGLVVESIGIADVPIPVKIESVNNHAAKRMLERGMTESDAQSFIDNAMVKIVEKAYDVENIVYCPIFDAEIDDGYC